MRRARIISSCPAGITKPVAFFISMKLLFDGIFVGIFGLCGQFHQFVKFIELFRYIRESDLLGNIIIRVIGLWISKSSSSFVIISGKDIRVIWRVRYISGVVANMVLSFSGRKTYVVCNLGLHDHVFRGGGVVLMSVKKLRICVFASEVFI